MEAMKAHDQNARGVYSVLINKCMLKSVELKTQNASLTDGDTLVLINKTIKELDEEYETYKKLVVKNKHQLLLIKRAYLKSIYLSLCQKKKLNLKSLNLMISL